MADRNIDSNTPLTIPVQIFTIATLVLAITWALYRLLKMCLNGPIFYTPVIMNDDELQRRVVESFEGSGSNPLIFERVSSILSSERINIKDPSPNFFGYNIYIMGYISFNATEVARQIQKAIELTDRSETAYNFPLVYSKKHRDRALRIDLNRLKAFRVKRIVEELEKTHGLRKQILYSMAEVPFFEFDSDGNPEWKRVDPGGLIPNIKAVQILTERIAQNHKFDMNVLRRVFQYCLMGVALLRDGSRWDHYLECVTFLAWPPSQTVMPVTKKYFEYILGAYPSSGFINRDLMLSQEERDLYVGSKRSRTMDGSNVDKEYSPVRADVTINLNWLTEMLTSENLTIVLDDEVGNLNELRNLAFAASSKRRDSILFSRDKLCGKC